jgi:hypothetical protein
MQDWSKIWAADILVRDRVVHFWFSHHQSEERRALRVAAENFPGVRGVEEHIVPAPARDLVFIANPARRKTGSASSGGRGHLTTSPDRR